MDQASPSRRVFLTTLGTSAYVSVPYALDMSRDAAAGARDQFVQVACLRDLQDRELMPERVVVLLTAEARKKNWDDDPNNGSGNGLRTDLLGLGLGEGQLCPVDIPAGVQQEELWAIFEKVVDQIEPGDQLFIDITHGFRSLPTVMVMALNFALRAKGASLEEVRYGAFETAPRDDVDSPRPVFELSPIFALNRWIDGLAVLRATGDFRALAHLVQDQAKEGKKLLRKDYPSSLTAVAKKLNIFGEALMAGQFLRLPKTAAEAVAALEASQTDIQLPEHAAWKPLGFLLRELVDKVVPFCGQRDTPPDLSPDELTFHASTAYAGLHAAGWFLVNGPHNHWLLGMTLAREAAVSTLAAWDCRMRFGDRPEQALAALSRSVKDPRMVYENLYGWLAQKPVDAVEPHDTTRGWKTGNSDEIQNSIQEAGQVAAALVAALGQKKFTTLRADLNSLGQFRNAFDHAFTSRDARDQKVSPGKYARELKFEGLRNQLVELIEGRVC
jgi:CRISPR-associated Csx2 family protein